MISNLSVHMEFRTWFSDLLTWSGARGLLICRHAVAYMVYSFVSDMEFQARFTSFSFADDH